MSLTILIFLFSALLFVCYRIFKWWQFRRVMNKIPKPFNGSPFYFLSNPDQVFTLFRKLASENYPIYRMSSILVLVVALLDPDDVEKVLSNSKHLQKSRIYYFLHQWLGTGLLTSTGTKWQNRRKILTPAFHFSILQKFVNVFNEEARKLVDALEDNSVVNLIPTITHFTLQSITETAMGLKDIDKHTQIQYKNAIYKMGRILLKRVTNPLLLINFIYKFTKLAKEEKKVIGILHDFSNNIIEQRQKERNFTNKGLLDILLKAKEEGADIDNEGIREEVDTFMFEGHDTSAMAITFILFTLAKHKDVQARIYEEIQEVTSVNPTYYELQELKYTECCIKECLRLYPSVPFITRLAGETFTSSSGYTILKDTIIHLHIYDIHRNSRIYPDPLKFDPDRFLPENTKTRHPFAFIPFSAGQRNCIGQRFALLEIKVVLCAILRRFVLESMDYEVEFRPDLVLRPKNDVKIRIFAR